jgi:hypothetical protein
MDTQFTVPTQEPYHLTRVIQRFAGAAREISISVSSG